MSAMLTEAAVESKCGMGALRKTWKHKDLAAPGRGETGWMARLRPARLVRRLGSMRTTVERA